MRLQTNQCQFYGIATIVVPIVRLVLTFWGKVRAIDTNTRTDAFLQQNERRFKLYSVGTTFL